MATHTPAQAIQELVNHTAVLTERLVGLQTEVRKGMAASPELSNTLTQVVGDTKRMLQAIEHLARLPAFHLDRDGLNAAVAAGVQQGLSAGGGSSLAEIIEANSRNLEEARKELIESKKRMDQMLEEIHGTKAMTPEGKKELFMQFAPVVMIWSVAMIFVGVLIGSWLSSGSNRAQTVQNPPAIVQQQTRDSAAQPSRLTRGQQFTLQGSVPLFNLPGDSSPAYSGVQGMVLTVIETRSDGWARVGFKTGPNQNAVAWLPPAK